VDLARRAVHLSFKVPGQPFSTQVLANLRTDHSGEVGAVCICKGLSTFSRDAAFRYLTEHDLATAEIHFLDFINGISVWLPLIFSQK